MSSSEERQCINGGEFHLRNISFFAYWVQCKECGTYICPQCSGYRNQRITQFTFLVYMLVSEIFYLGIFFIFGPIKGGTVSVVTAYIFAGVLLFIPFLFLLYRIRSTTRELSRQPEVITNCHKCQGPINIISHDIFLYFYIFLIHALYLSTILNETGIFFYNLILYGYKYGFYLSFIFLTLLIGIIIFIISFFKKIGRKFFSMYKMNTRAWLGEILAIFFYMSINIIILFFLTIITNIIPITQFMNDALISFILFYNFTSIVFWYFPAFLIGSLIYKIAQKYLLNINKSKILQVLISILYVIIPFYLWGLISLNLGVYSEPTFYNDLLPFYSTIFNEIIPLLIVSILLGISISSLFRKFFTNNPDNPQNSFLKSLILIGISFFTLFLIFENLYYFITGTLFLDNLSTSIIPLVIVLILIGSLTLILYEIISNWSSSKIRWGKFLEKRLGSLLYPILLGFILVAISLSFSVIVLISTTSPLISDFDLITNRNLLKLIFTIGFISGLFIGFKK